MCAGTSSGRGREMLPFPPAQDSPSGGPLVDPLRLWSLPGPPRAFVMAFLCKVTMVPLLVMFVLLAIGDFASGAVRQTPLPYPENALEPFLSAENVRWHCKAPAPPSRVVPPHAPRRVRSLRLAGLISLVLSYAPQARSILTLGGSDSSPCVRAADRLHSFYVKRTNELIAGTILDKAPLNVIVLTAPYKSELYNFSAQVRC
jgi:hypothetical protein